MLGSHQHQGSSRVLEPCQGPSEGAEGGEELSGAPGTHTGMLAGYPNLWGWVPAPHGSWSCFSVNGSSFSASPTSFCDCPGNGWSSSGAGARGAWEWPQHRAQPWEKGTAGMTFPSESPLSCFIHTIPNKCPLPLGFSPLKCHKGLAQLQGQGNRNFHSPRTKVLFVTNEDILQMFWIYLYKELLPSGSCVLGYFSLNTVIYTCLFI